jgi:hypothetical protein
LEVGYGSAGLLLLVWIEGGVGLVRVEGRVGVECSRLLVLVEEKGLVWVECALLLVWIERRRSMWHISVAPAMRLDVSHDEEGDNDSSTKDS